MSFTPTYSIFTHSVGYHTRGHSLLAKLDAIAAAGIRGVEIFTDDLWYFSQSEAFASILACSPSCSSETALLTPPDSPLARHSYIHSKTPPPAEEVCCNAYGTCTREASQLEIAAAKYISSYCAERGLEVICLQPLRDVEGWVEEVDREAAMARVRSRFDVMQALNTSLLLICSNNTPAPRTTGDLASLVRDFTRISDMASSFTRQTGHVVRVGYEALSWGSHVDLWSQAWAVVKSTNRSNIGLILDSFNTLGREFADPCSPSGIQEPIPHTLSALATSLKRITTEVPGEKVFLLQIGDAKRMPTPLLPSPREGEERPSRMIWSRSSRLFPCEESRGAFMPVKEFVGAVVDAGYKGAWSIEVFNDSLDDAAAKVPREHATRAREGLDRLVEVVFA